MISLKANVSPVVADDLTDIPKFLRRAVADRAALNAPPAPVAAPPGGKVIAGYVLAQPVPERTRKHAGVGPTLRALGWKPKAIRALTPALAEQYAALAKTPDDVAAPEAAAPPAQPPQQQETATMPKTRAKVKKEPRVTAGSRFRELILANQPTAEILATVRREFPASKIKDSYVRWYCNDLEKAGKKLPSQHADWKAVRAAAKEKGGSKKGGSTPPAPSSAPETPTASA